MRRRSPVLACAAAVLAAALPAAAPAAPLAVTAGIPPAAYFVERIGGALVRVRWMVPPGTTDEETWAPGPRQVADMLRSRLYVAVGLPGFPLEENLLLPLLRSHPDVRVASMARGIPLLPAPGGGAPAAGGDPHVWLAPGTVAIAARNVAAGLVAADPAHRAAYLAGLAAFGRDLAALDAAFRRAAAGPRPVRFLSYHPAWGYLARQYGFEQRVVESGGKDPGTESLLALVAAARRDRVRLVLVPPGMPPRTVEALAGSIGGRALALDYLAHDWLAMMTRLAAALAEVARGA